MNLSKLQSEAVIKCENCKGIGKVNDGRKPSASYFDQGYKGIDIICPKCEGTGQDQQKPKELTCNKHITQVSNCYTSKPKELDWADTLYDMANCSTECQTDWSEIETFIEELLTQQRTELLEEIKKDVLKITDNGYDCICSGHIEDYFKNLINK